MQCLELRQLRAGQNAITQGDPGNEFFIVVTGSLSVNVRVDAGGETAPKTVLVKTVALIGEGDHFGEMALEGPANSLRRASCVCREASTLAVLQRRVYDMCAPLAIPARARALYAATYALTCLTCFWKLRSSVRSVGHALAVKVLLGRSAYCSVQSWIVAARRYVRSQTELEAAECFSALSLVPTFAALREFDIRALARICTMRTIGPGEIVYRQGDLLNDVLIVQSGIVKCVREMESRQQAFRRDEFLPEPQLELQHGAPHGGDPKWAHVRSPVKEFVGARGARLRAPDRPPQPQNAAAEEPDALVSARTKVPSSVCKLLLLPC